MTEYDIDEEDVTVVTTDTAANQKNAIVVQTNLEWLPCICHVMELVMGVLMKRLSGVSRNLYLVYFILLGAVSMCGALLSRRCSV